MFIRRRTLMLALLLLLMGMVFGGELWLETVRKPFLALIYWGLCILLTLAIILLALGELRYLRMLHFYRKRQLLKKTIRDKDFQQKLAEKKLKLVIEEQDQSIDEKAD